MIKVRFSAARIALSSVLLAAMVGYIAYSLAPQIKVLNQSELTLSQVSVHLPRSRAVFDAIEPGASATVFHSAQQADGRYNYIVTAEDGQRQVGSCGRVRARAYGQRITLRVEAPFKVSCQAPTG